ncbi:MAG TPA: family 78 glycoside hydrolase catalytic domain [Lacunisphaera sp.]|nr:family 78 glycoside hydrolase catalytic domain [Lacunisphaera sp.]
MLAPTWLARSPQAATLQVVRRRAALHALVLGGLIFSLGSMRGDAAYEVAALKCESAVDPLGVDVAQPRLSWQVKSDENGQRQTAWQVLVASSREVLAADRGDLWDSGRVDGDQTTFVGYGGVPLRESQQVFWKVRSWDRAGKAGAWSEPASWTMGLLAPEQWKAQWITAAGTERLENTLLRREFVVRPGLRRAVAHVTGLGQYELFLNGTKAGTDVLSPGWTDYKDTVLYDTRDVTALLREGANAAGLSLGNGMLHVVRPPGRFAKFLGSFGPQRAILHLRLEYADGSVETVVTDETWKTHAGPITFSSIYGGEDFDARRVQAGWNRPAFSDGKWTPAVVFPGAPGVLRGQSRAAESVAPIETRAVAGVRELSPGVVLYDFGQNASFMPRIRVSGPAGSVVKLTAGEVVNADGTINRGTMGGAHRGSAWWQYTKATDGEETWFPQFYYLGSRYLYVELMPATVPDGGSRSAASADPAGLPKVESVEMVVVHSTAAPVGHFAASDPTLNRIRDLVRWAQRSNLVSVLTDCPHREKLGWLEQNHLNGPALRYEWDLARLAAKNVHDMAEAQTEDGLIPNIAPEYTVFKGTFRAAAEWGASFILVPWQQYLFTGDAALLRGHYDAMKRYFAYLEGRAAGGLLEEGLGDWYDQVLGKPGRAYLTPPPVTATAHYYQNAEVLAKAAALLGHADDARDFASKAAAIRTIFNREFFKPGTPELYGSGSQTSLILPLAMGLAEPADRDAVLAALLQDIAARGHSSAGAIGTRYLFRALTDAGHSDLLYRLVTNPDMPGYAYQLKQGATSLAESWTAQQGASQNHFFLGQVVEWFYHDLAGIQPDEAVPGFKHVVIRPHPVEALTWVEASHESIHGPIRVRWDRRDGKFLLKVTIPANTTATVVMPSRDGKSTAREIESGTHAFEAAW